MNFSNVGRPSIDKNSDCTGTTIRSQATIALTVRIPMFGGQSIRIASYFLLCCSRSLGSWSGTARKSEGLVRDSFADQVAPSIIGVVGFGRKMIGACELLELCPRHYITSNANRMPTLLDSR